MPKKAVALYLFLALLGAATFVFFTFPRTKDEIPRSNNQRPFPSAPGPNNMPPETPRPTAPAAPHGPTLRVMAWASPAEAQALGARTDAYADRTGQIASLTVVGDATTYRHDLAQALASATPPDLCLIEARDFSGTDPAHDFVAVPARDDVAPRAIDAFTVGTRVMAAPAEYDVEVLFYNPTLFDRAGLARPGPHWNWDVLEAMTRGLAVQKMKTDAGEPIYPLELPADFDFWNILCTQAGHPALDADVWHLAEGTSRAAQMRSLDFIHTFFQDLAVAAPLPREGTAPGTYFAKQQAALLIGPSSLAAGLPRFGYQITLLPGDMRSGTLARVNGWAVAARSTHPEAARALAAFLARTPIHAGWSGVVDLAPAPGNVPRAALDQAILPRVTAHDLPLAQFLDMQIAQWARHSGGSTDQLYARIQAEYQSGQTAQTIESSPPKPAEKLKPRALAPGELRDL